MTATIARGHRVQVIATGATGTIDRERPADWPYCFRVTDYANRVQLGWFSADELAPATPDELTADEQRLARKGAALLTGGQS